MKSIAFLHNHNSCTDQNDKNETDSPQNKRRRLGLTCSSISNSINDTHGVTHTRSDSPRSPMDFPAIQPKTFVSTLPNLATTVGIGRSKPASQTTAIAKTTATATNITTSSKITYCIDISAVDTIDDIILNILQFFTGPQAIDIPSLLNTMLVNKRWNAISSSQKFWRNVRIPSLRNLRRSKINPAIVMEDGDVSTARTLQHRLIGYANLGQAEGEGHQRQDQVNFLYKVRERATGKLFQLEISQLDKSLRGGVGEGENSHQRSSDGTTEDGGMLARHLREINLRNDMYQLAEENRRHLSLVQEWGICDLYTLVFHDYSEYTLQTFMNQCGSEFRSRPRLLKGIIFQILQGVQSLHNSGMTHRALDADCINVFGDEDECVGGDSIPLVKITNFGLCRKHQMLDADNCDIIELKGRGLDKVQDEIGIQGDLYSVGQILLRMIKRPDNTFTKKLSSQATSLDHDSNSMREMSNCVEEIESIVGAFGVDLLKRLLCPLPGSRLSVSDAMQHQYFADHISFRESVHFSSQETCKQLQILHNMELNRDKNCSMDNIHFSSGQAAAMVDWLFEIASVFHLSTRTVFLAVGYYNTCSMRSNITDMLPHNISFIGNYQLLAATCLYIASKCEDDSHAEVANLVFSADRIFRPSDIIALEQKVLNMIDWTISMPTVYDFATSYMNRTAVHSSSRLFWLTLYICELALESTIHHEFEPSKIAACVTVLSKYSADMEEVWTKEMETLSRCKWDDLFQCLLKLSSMLEARQGFTSLSIIDRRYRKNSRMCVSRVCVKPIKSSAQLKLMYPRC